MPIRIEGTTLYTVKDLEQMLGAGNSTIRRYISDGRLKGRKLARRWYIPAESLLEYFKENDQSPPPTLLEKLKKLEQKLLEKEDSEFEELPKLPKKHRRRGRPSALLRLNQEMDQLNPVESSSPSPAVARERMVVEDQDAKELLEQARRLKEEAERLERMYASERD